MRSAARTNRPDEETGVADVRRVRNRIAQQHQGDIAGHVAQTKRVAEPIRKKLGIKLVSRHSRTRRSGTDG